ncbi:FMN-dependent NADH-azoreductase [Roseibium marinum]|uniref:FMN dependent NADH:quinone oxidoreductase n=1 Tax=Roseibium marinum TaxID=281252 RepID=A0A2S3UWN9_9HYPH|nr:NAD(P)H-dependent oxidoreductase [Roseibium marinum]POF32096.1 FMN-dependent NADH-azoreductase [Roseibium marinum]
MNTLLQINSGLKGPKSHSSRLAASLSRALLSTHPGAKLIRRDLSEKPIPHLDHATFRTFLDPGTAMTPDQKAGLARSDALIAELKEADVLVIGAPMYNFMVPSTLKSWIDHVVRAGETFQFTEAGPAGLLKDKEAYVAIAQGGKFLGTPQDLETGFLKMVLNLMGISKIKFVYAEGLAMGDEMAAAGLAAAQRTIDHLCAANAAQTPALETEAGL